MSPPPTYSVHGIARHKGPKSQICDLDRRQICRFLDRSLSDPVAYHELSVRAPDIVSTRVHFLMSDNSDLLEFKRLSWQADLRTMQLATQRKQLPDLGP